MKNKNNIKARVVYVPGYGGNNERSTTYKALLEAFGDNHEVVCLQYDNHNPVKARIQLVDQLEKNLKENPEVILVGTSLGGYFANYLNEIYDVPTILVNPSYDPSINLKNRNVPKMIYDQFDLPVFTKGRNKEIFLGGLDDVVDPIVTQSVIGDKYPIHFFPNEGHRFVDKSPIIHSINHKIYYLADTIN